MHNYWLKEDKFAVELFRKQFNTLYFEQETPAIPKLIHFIWVGAKPIPDSFKNEILPVWIEKHPDFEVKIWGEDDLDTMELRNSSVILNKELNPGLRADFLRLEILHKYGGIYADVDMTCEQSFLPLLSLHASFISGVSNTSAFESNNGLIISAPAHPFVSFMISELEGSYKFQLA